MIKQTLIHQKNILVAKSVIYMIIIIISCALIIKITKDYNEIITTKTESELSLNSAKKISKSLDSLENKVFELGDKYQKLKEDSNKHQDVRFPQFINAINKLSEKHNLFPSIVSDVKRNVAINKKPLYLYYYNIDLIINAPTYNTMFSVIKDIESCLPSEAFIFSTQIQENDVLTPNIIDKLNTKRNPDLINAKMKIQLKKIIYEE